MAARKMRFIKSIRHRGAALATAGTMVLAAGASTVLPAMSAHATGSLQTEMQQIVDGGFPGAWAVDSNGPTGAAGKANIVTNAPTQAAMKTRIGSITKSFVATVALQLVDENQMGLDEYISDYVPGLLPYGDQVTVRQVLQQTSGIPDYLESGDNPLLVKFIRKSIPGNPGYDPTYKNKTWTPQQLVALIADQPRHVLPVNEAEYSDTNYIVVGMIIKAVTGHSVQYEVQNRIITPLNLTNTSFPTTSTNIPGLNAHGYTYNLDTDGLPIIGTMYDITNYNPSFIGSTGGMISNPADLNKFMSKLLGGQLLSADLTTQMKQTVPITLPVDLFPAGFGAGLGIWSWDLSQWPGACNKTIYGHEGEVPGFDTWSFGNASGNHTISMGVNLMVPDWDAYYDVELSTYASLWCN